MNNISLEEWATKYLSPAMKKHCIDLIENEDLFPSKEKLLKTLAKERIARRRERSFWVGVYVAALISFTYVLLRR